MPRRTVLAVAALALLCALPGCGTGGTPSVEAPAAAPETAAGAPGSDATAGTGRVGGRVLFKGAPPPPSPIAVTKDVTVCGAEPHVSEALVVGAGGGLKNAVVSLEGVAGGREFPVDPRPVLDQRGCWFHPHVLVIPAGATLEIRNSDGILHNIHTYPGSNPPINMAQPKFRKVLTTSFERPDIVKVACDVHGWMTAWIVVAGHPYHAVTGDDGGFSLEGVPPGTYTLRVWHETLGTREQPVAVAPGAVVETTLAFGS